jgi:hypothetical protein
MYDIYLSKGCRVLPDLSGFVQQIPAFADKQLVARLLEEEPGFLGLELPLETARPLIKLLKYSETRALGRIVPSKYRQQPATLTRETAYPLAEQTLKQEQLNYPTTSFGPIVFDSEDLMWFEFCTVSEEWIAQGMIPGALIVCVDKLDGHIWQDEEFEHLFGNI